MIIKIDSPELSKFGPFFREIKVFFGFLVFHFASSALARMFNPEIDTLSFTIMFITGLLVLVMTFLFVCIPVAYRKYLKLSHSSKWDTYISDLRSMTIKQQAGFVYLMRRSDGIYKIGRSHDCHKRRTDHVQAYQQEIDIVSVFLVPDMISFEKLALKLTSDSFYEEDGRRELRCMTDKQVIEFTDIFNNYIFAWNHLL